MKTFRLYKRGDDGRELPATSPGYADRPYYCRFNFRGQTYTRTLETNIAVEAQTRARAQYKLTTEKIIRGEYKRLDTPPAAPVAIPLERLFALYRTGPSEASAATREMNIASLARMLPKDAQSVADITPAAFRAYFTAVTARANSEVQQTAGASYKRSANSTWAKAKSLFTPRCLAHYADHGVTIDASLVLAGELAKFSSRSLPKIAYNPPADTILEATLKAWQDLTDRNLFLAIGHELAFGLRIGEMSQARWSWWTARAGYPVLDNLDEAVTVKNQTGLIQVRALDPWYTIMKTRIEVHHWRPPQTPDPKSQTPDASSQTQPYIIEGSDAYRTDGIYRAVSDWLRQLGWRTKKTNHALRAYAGSQVAMKFGIYEAQMWLRHSTVKVTEQHYTHFVSKFKPADLDTLPAKWATLQTAFVPQIIPLPAAG